MNTDDKWVRGDRRSAFGLTGYPACRSTTTSATIRKRSSPAFRRLASSTRAFRLPWRLWGRRPQGSRKTKRRSSWTGLASTGRDDYKIMGARRSRPAMVPGMRSTIRSWGRWSWAAGTPHTWRNHHRLLEAGRAHTDFAIAFAALAPHIAWARSQAHAAGEGITTCWRWWKTATSAHNGSAGAR